MYFGMVTWFIIRWVLIIASYLLIYRLGGMEGTFWERLGNLKLPKIQISFGQSGASRNPANTGGLVIDYLTILVDVFDNSEAAKAQQKELHRARINSVIIPQQNKYYVCVGQYKTEGRAAGDLTAIKQKGFANARVTGTPR